MGSWESPDDLVWAYSRQLKQISEKLPPGAARLYVSESDMRHYITPWCSFPNGALFMPEAAPAIVANLKATPRWSTSEIVHLVFADGWDTGLNMGTLQWWQEYVEFDKHLREINGKGLEERTHKKIEAEVDSKFADQWNGWHLERYVASVRALREAFKSEGKTLVITAQGVPMVAGAAGRELSLTIRGIGDDCTWGMLDDSAVLTTGRQMSMLAFNPVWQMSTLVAWGFNSALFNNWQWHNPVGTAAPTRRNIYDRAWRGTLRPGKPYGSVYTYGYTSNAMLLTP